MELYGKNIFARIGKSLIRTVVDIDKHRLLPNMGGQAGLNLGMELDESGFLAEHGVTLLGTTAKTR